MKVENTIPENIMKPIGHYSHVSKVGPFITIGGTAGVNPETGELVGLDVGSQTKQILDAFEIMLLQAESGFSHVMHINIFLADIKSFKQMDLVYGERLGIYRPARTTIGGVDLPKSDALITMNLTAITKC
ncbi:RidA family protein [Sneathiella aquimaris]|uniref:RidA family protein n=1 Tax=Sneathiella aquimaris TaxID=2599305 RepID=UPI001469EF8B|nr:RidA family protein [Sneathiella aquimaris]